MDFIVMATREDGYYWILMGREWTIAEWQEDRWIYGDWTPTDKEIRLLSGPIRKPLPDQWRTPK